MSNTVERAIERLRQMPADQRELFAQFVLHEIEEDERWLRSTESSTEKLTDFVTGVLEADRQGECEPLDPDKL